MQPNTSTFNMDLTYPYAHVNMHKVATFVEDQRKYRVKYKKNQSGVDHSVGCKVDKRLNSWAEYRDSTN